MRRQWRQKDGNIHFDVRGHHGLKWLVLEYDVEHARVISLNYIDMDIRRLLCTVVSGIVE